jgi:branched-subunit amino acid aminotransferase/4-amino-4-deoxychorismate lyase
MHSLIYCNDRIVDAAAARIAPMTAGLLYGWGVFTTLRVYEKKVFAFGRHWERLTRHAQQTDIEVPLDLDSASRALEELLKANSVRSGRARITLIKGDAGAWRLSPGRSSEFLIFTAADSRPPLPQATITISPYRVLSHGPLAGIKRTAMLENLLALEEARSRGFAEAVLVNERGEMAGGTAANLFWVDGGQLFTPSLATGCVGGVTRALIHEIATRLHLEVIEGSFPIGRLLGATEVFLTSTSREILPVASFDIKEYDLKRAGVTRSIRREFQKLIRGAKIG